MGLPVQHTSSDTTLSSGLTAFSIPGVDPNAIVNHLREKHNIVVRTTGDKATNSLGVRVSTHIWVSLKDVDLLLQGVDEIARRAWGAVVSRWAGRARGSAEGG